MSRFVITTDSNADLPKEYIEKHELTILPQYYAFGEEVYGDEQFLPVEEFYSKMAEGEMPTSMANNPDVIQKKFSALLEQGLDILHIAFSSELSGSYNNVAVMANELLEAYPQRRITVIDSGTVSLGESVLVMKAMDLKAEGKTMEEIARWVEENKKHVHVQFTVDDINHLQRGGRISKTTSIVLGIANIKPLLHVKDTGELGTLGTVRGRKRSLATLISNMEETFEKNRAPYGRIGLVHARCLQDVENMKNKILEKHPEAEVIINDISPSIGTHAGPGAVGLCYLAVPEK